MLAPDMPSLASQPAPDSLALNTTLLCFLHRSSWCIRIRTIMRTTDLQKHTVGHTAPLRRMIVLSFSGSSLLYKGTSSSSRRLGAVLHRDHPPPPPPAARVEKRSRGRTHAHGTHHGAAAPGAAGYLQVVFPCGGRWKGHLLVQWTHIPAAPRCD